MQKAESYRSSLIGSIQQLERMQSSDRDVQDRLQQLRSELSRVENRMIDAKRR
jgi:predicted nuclease with TOPRIM domain